MGCVYILRNPAMPDLIKIGYTTRTAEARANELYEGALGVPKPFVVVHTNDCEEPQKLEAKVHKRLAEYRINNNREFFKCPADDAYQLVKKLHKENQQDKKNQQKRKRPISKREIKAFFIGNSITIVEYGIKALQYVLKHLSSGHN